MTTITLHIDRLILDGVDVAPGDRAALLAAVETELTHLLIASGLADSFQAGGVLPSLRGSALALQPGSHPTHLGVNIAQAAYSGLGPARDTATALEAQR